MSCFSLLYLQHVRRAAVLALSTAAHNKPNLIKGLLLEMLQFFYVIKLLLRYLQDQKILDGVSFVVPAGRSVAIVGTSGSDEAKFGWLLLE
ncbi:hypothetical protein HPP92_027390 [Vanilla planifolia]|uniref:Uncharacterized protein n=1 Tax=Vanilla planifolia TaxID=51239 RepID=A0A835U5B9_VANPL|nr:hypothetical protein HPP92_027390 [Vanilla planifolia]